jgi:hypothetical protein
MIRMRGKTMAGYCRSHEGLKCMILFDVQSDIGIWCNNTIKLCRRTLGSSLLSALLYRRRSPTVKRNEAIFNVPLLLFLHQ